MIQKDPKYKKAGKYATWTRSLTPSVDPTHECQKREMCEQPVKSLHLTGKCNQPTGWWRRKDENEGKATLYKNNLTNIAARSRNLPNHRS